MKGIEGRKYGWRVRGLAVLGLAGISLAAYGGVRAAATRTAEMYGPLSALGQEPRVLTGTTPLLTVARPSGQATFNVTFPAAFRTPPTVLITVVGGGDTPVIGRLTGPATTSGFQGVLTAPYFLNRLESATVYVNWMAVGDTPPRPR